MGRGTRCGGTDLSQVFVIDGSDDHEMDILQLCAWGYALLLQAQCVGPVVLACWGHGFRAFAPWPISLARIRLEFVSNNFRIMFE